MSFLKASIEARDRLILQTVLVELTYRCNLDCVFCYNDLGLRGRPVSTERYLELWQELAEMEVFELVLTGGEPLAHADFLVLGRRARDLGFVVRLKSNGHALSPGYAERIKAEVDPFAIDISLHGATAETHDRQTRVAGSFERLCSNIEGASAAGLRLKLNATLTRWNEHQIEEMFALADGWGLQLSMSTSVTPRDNGDTSPMALRPSEEAMNRLTKVFEARAAKSGRATRRPEVKSRMNCGTGTSMLAIDPYGSVLPCLQWRRPIGSIHESTIRELWENAPQLVAVRGLNAEAQAKKATLGDRAATYQHCLGLAEMLAGDPLAMDEIDPAGLAAPAKGEGTSDLLPVLR